jgi:DNA-directed RNA polymerase subunit K/omega
MRRDIPLYDELMAGEKVKNKYQFILAVAKRARMIVDGAPSAPGVLGAKPTTRALGELLTGKIGFRVGSEEPKK